MSSESAAGNRERLEQQLTEVSAKRPIQAGSQQRRRVNPACGCVLCSWKCWSRSTRTRRLSTKGLVQRSGERWQRPALSWVRARSETNPPLARCSSQECPLQDIVNVGTSTLTNSSTGLGIKGKDPLPISPLSLSSQTPSWRDCPASV
jgi:hypothetical protein